MAFCHSLSKGVRIADVDKPWHFAIFHPKKRSPAISKTRRNAACTSDPDLVSIRRDQKRGLQARGHDREVSTMPPPFTTEYFELLLERETPVIVTLARHTRGDGGPSLSLPVSSSGAGVPGDRTLRSSELVQPLIRAM